jgi:hypothetical protein
LLIPRPTIDSSLVALSNLVFGAMLFPRLIILSRKGKYGLRKLGDEQMGIRSPSRAGFRESPNFIIQLHQNLLHYRRAKVVSNMDGVFKGLHS